MAREYKAYLIRLQRNNDGEPWRATLQNAHTGEHQHFATEHEMLRHLMQILGDSDFSQSQGNPDS